jgi:hypothetical protein
VGASRKPGAIHQGAIRQDAIQPKVLRATPCVRCTPIWMRCCASQERTVAYLIFRRHRFGWVIRSWRKSSAWLVIALMVILPLVALYFFMLEPEYHGTSQWGAECTMRLPFKGIIEVSCAKLRAGGPLLRLLPQG